MIILNGNNTKEELDKISRNCPDKLLVRLILGQVNSSNFYLGWLFKFYDSFHIRCYNKNNFIKASSMGISIAFFEIDFTKIPSDIFEIEVAMNETHSNEKSFCKNLSSVGFMLSDSSDDNMISFGDFRFDNEKEILNRKSFSVCTFSRISDNWKCYPRIENVYDTKDWQVIPSLI